MLTCMEEKGDKSSLKEVKGMTARQVTKLEQQEAVWYLDNGASNHMTGNLSNFIELDKAVKGWVRFGDNSKVQIMGIGSILLQCKNGEQRLITEVYFIPSLCHNILSLGQITEEGGKVEMLGQHLCVFNKDGRLFIKVQRTSNRLYKVNLQATKPLELVHADLCGPITQSTSAARIKFAEDEGDSRCEKSQGAMSGSRGRMLELILPYCMIAAAASNSENDAAVKQDKESATKTWLVQLQVMEESGHHARSVQQLKMEVEQPSGECGAVQQQHYELWGSAASYGGMLQVVQQCFKTMKRWKTCCKVQLQGSGEVAASSAALTTQHSVERFSGNAGAIAAARSCKGGDAAVRNMEQLQDRAWSTSATWGLHGVQKQRREVLHGSGAARRAHGAAENEMGKVEVELQVENVAASGAAAAKWSCGRMLQDCGEGAAARGRVLQEVLIKEEQQKPKAKKVGIWETWNNKLPRL